MICFVKVSPASGMESAYSVVASGGHCGYVWKRRGFSYRGMQGWNRGIRVKDFHPVEWRWGTTLGIGQLSTYSRRIAAERLIESLRSRP